ncbi:MAG: helix-turn-helix domain-containing protein [Anaerolineales bacterium]|jgi:transcriptional regulator with XRE-family HTH domain
MDNKGSVGIKLRTVREERGLSQRELAQRAGVSTNAISLIERDENSPSVSTLQSLATALNVRMSYFFDDHEPTQVLHVKADSRPAISNKGVQIEGLDGKLNYQEMEPFLVSLQPNSGSGERQVVHTGHEMVYCLSGNVEYLIDGKIYSLEVGDILLFEAHLPHLWRNVTDEEATILLVLQSTGQTAQSVERHFSDYPSLKHIGK